ncbi:hypothetical protein CO540_13450 [Micromonospora sp. WMMA2032]|uniref:hypothetical protein n=1 Tax=Micromonospora sp. WMMA2032 TaxID=2039870 RepID=UPI000C05A8C7|nr:hypothetical protein [Micromonospora sp. WMMA2032]ATO14712.1 hypothetical protein CO540_13450 [Micromonospora sp. WMMA2032]
MRRSIHRAILIAGLGAGATLGVLALADDPAQADDKPAAVQSPGGALDRGLPGRPVKKLLDAVTDVVPVKVDPKPEAPAKDEPADEPTPPAPKPDPEPTREPEPKPEPTRDPEPEPTKPVEPTAEPTQPGEDRDTDQADPEPEPTEAAPTPEPTETTAPLCDVPLVDGVCQVVEDVVEVVDEVVPPVEVDVPPVVVDVPPLVVDVPPIVVDVPPVVVTLPATDPAPLPDADATPQPTASPTSPAPVVVTPGQLPVPIGPQATEATTPVATVGELPAAALEDLPPPDCAEPVDQATAGHVDYRTVLERHRLTKRGMRVGTRSAPGCPKPGQPDGGKNCTDATTGGSSNSHQHGQPLGDVTSMLAQPTLDQLRHARPRSQIPPSRHTSIEPGPA